MAKITVEVKGVNSGGGNQNQSNTPQQPQSSPQQPTQSQPQQPAGGSQSGYQPSQTTSNQQPTQQQTTPTQPSQPQQPTPSQPTQPNQPSQPQQQPTQQPNQPSQPNQPTPPPVPPKPPVPPTPPTGPGNTPPNKPQPYQRIDPNQYIPQRLQNPAMPASDRMVEDIRREISQRGVLLVPGTANFSTMMNTLQQNQRNAINANILSQYDKNIESVEDAREKAHADAADNVYNTLQAALVGITDPIKIKNLKDKYSRIEEQEHDRIDAAFDPIVQRIQNDRAQAENESEENLTRAIQELTNEIKQGNPDSYLNRLRDDYKTAIWKRDNAMTEEDAIAASKEASQIQERIGRAQGAPSQTAMKWLGVAGTALTVGGQMLYRADLLADQKAWGLGIDQASAVLNGNAFQAIRQKNAIESQQTSNYWQAGGTIGGAALGAAIGSLFGGVGAIPGWVIGTMIGGAAGQWAGTYGADYIGGNRERLRQDYRVQAADLWRNEEQRIMQFNDLAMLTRGTNDNVEGVRNWYITRSFQRTPEDYGEDERGTYEEPKRLPPARVPDWVRNHPDNQTEEQQRKFDEMDKKADEYERKRIDEVTFKGRISQPLYTTDAFEINNEGLDLYDLGYTAPEFAQKAAQRIKQRGMVDKTSVGNALYADALERVFSMNSGALGNLSQFDRYGNDANQDFANLAMTLARRNTIGMQRGGWARSDEYLGYMNQLNNYQRSTFLDVNSDRSARQIATASAVFNNGRTMSPEALQMIQAVSGQVQNPGAGYAKTILYDVIQQLYPETRGDITAIEKMQYNGGKNERTGEYYQTEIQNAVYKRIKEMYGGVDTQTGYLAMKEIYGISNPNLLLKMARTMDRGGLESEKLEQADQEDLVSPMTRGGYTPRVTKKLNQMADSQMAALLEKEDRLIEISDDLLNIIRNDIRKTLEKAVKKLGNYD